jgi:hypothetical protein
VHAHCGGTTQKYTHNAFCKAHVDSSLCFGERLRAEAEAAWMTTVQA